MNKYLLLFLAICTITIHTFGSNDTIQAEYDSFYMQLKEKYSTVETDSISALEVQQLIAFSRNFTQDLVSKLNLPDTTVTKAHSVEDHSEGVSELFKMDQLHLISYGVVGLLFILFLIFMFAYFSARKKYHNSHDELYDMEEILEKFDSRKGTPIKKLENMFKKYNDINTRFESIETDKLNVEENLSFVKLENTKLIEKNQELEKTLDDKENLETESISKILEMEKIIESQRNEISEKDRKIIELEASLKDSGIATQLPDDKKAELDDLDFNIAKIEKLNKLKKSKAISDEEFEELKQKIISNF